MAVIQGASSSGGYEKHPEGGRYRGYIRQVWKLDDKVSRFPKPGSDELRDVPTIQRQLIVENCDGKAQYDYTDDDGTTTTHNHSCTTYFAIYDGSVSPKTKVGKLYASILGEAPAMPFDDEQVLGTYVTYMCEHSEDGQYANCTSIRADHDQSPPDSSVAIVKTVTQAEQAAKSGSNSTNSSTPATAQQQADSAPQEGTAGAREHLRNACRKWIVTGKPF